MPQRFDKAIRDEWLSLRKQSDVLAEPAQHNPDLLLPRPTQAPQTAPCPNCGAPIAPFILEHDLRCPHCGKVPSEAKIASLNHKEAHPFELDLEDSSAECPICGGPGMPLGRLGRRMHYRCRNCGMDFSKEEPLIDPNAARDFLRDVGPHFHGHVKISDVSMPPEGPPVQPKETALPYNPGAYEGMVENMHPAAQYTYERAVQQGASPEAAMSAAQEKQGEMMKRTQEGQNVEGVQIPVIS